MRAEESGGIGNRENITSNRRQLTNGGDGDIEWKKEMLGGSEGNNTVQ